MSEEEKPLLDSTNAQFAGDAVTVNTPVDRPPVFILEDIVYLHRLVNADIAAAKRLGAPDGHPHQLMRAKVLEKLVRIRSSMQPTR